ncbi:MAG: hypothetical protein WC365_09150 [Candidatus Babeliales bacterium]|jgi:hypothetical protein
MSYIEDIVEFKTPKNKRVLANFPKQTEKPTIKERCEKLAAEIKRKDTSEYYRLKATTPGAL